MSARFLTECVLFVLPVVFPSIATNSPLYGSLAGLSKLELDAIIHTTLQIRNFDPPPGPPGPLEYTGPKFVNDKDHPFEPLRPGDIRGPCPGLNTLASHGYLPRDGIVTPAQIINAVQEGFNMGNDIALFLTHCAILVDGNPLTNLLSIGSKTSKTGADLPPPAMVGGLDTYAVFEGDASMTRGDAFFGDNHSFNETLFEQFVNFGAQFGGGNYNFTVAAELRYQLIQESIAKFYLRGTKVFFCIRRIRLSFGLLCRRTYDKPNAQHGRRTWIFPKYEDA